MSQKSLMKGSALVRRIAPLCVLGAGIGLVGEGALAQGGDRTSKQDRQRQKQLEKEGRELFNTGTPKGGGQGKEGARESPGWFIVLESHTADGHAETATRRAAELASVIGASAGVRARVTAKGSAVVCGAFERHDSAQAEAELKRVRGLVVDGAQPFALAFLAPAPETPDIGRLPELSLSTARRTFGAAARYTLQVAVYQSSKDDERKRAAEQAAAVLRREGELAFYHHSPSMSVVTVGVFGDKDFDSFLRPTNPELIALQERYPHNLLNGQYPIVVRQAGQKEGTPQASSLVAIPE